MAKRKPLSKSVRYEILKRDSFTCQYCGAKAPDVLLEIDHIIPVAEGGTDDVINLITACRDCNRGKGKKMLSDTEAINRQRKQLDELSELNEQNKMLIEWKKELMMISDSQTDAIEALMHNIGFFDGSHRLTSHGRGNVKRLIKQFGFEEVYTATEIACETYVFGKGWMPERAFQKIGGICYNRKNQRGMENNDNDK